VSPMDNKRFWNFLFLLVILFVYSISALRWAATRRVAPLLLTDENDSVRYKPVQGQQHRMVRLPIAVWRTNDPQELIALGKLYSRRFKELLSLSDQEINEAA